MACRDRALLTFDNVPLGNSKSAGLVGKVVFEADDVHAVLDVDHSEHVILRRGRSGREQERTRISGRPGLGRGSADAGAQRKNLDRIGICKRVCVSLCRTKSLLKKTALSSCFFEGSRRQTTFAIPFHSSHYLLSLSLSLSLSLICRPYNSESGNDKSVHCFYPSHFKLLYLLPLTVGKRGIHCQS